MPWQPKSYPKNWQTLRATVLARAGNRCEGSPAFPLCRAENHQPHPVTGSKVVLTIAHLDHDKGDDIERLFALCQRCHLNFNAKQHAANAALTRTRKKYGENALLFGGES